MYLLNIHIDMSQLNINI